MDEMKDLGKYEPGAIEEKWYNFWEEHGVFHDEPEEGKEPYSIVLPPPNVTGQLHMGHALDNTLQDILIRYKRMQGYNVLWLPGKDHAGIATQVKVEKQIAEEGLTKYDLGREKFLERVWEWKEKYGNTIGKQIRRLGSSCDWSRERFTMDDVCARAVREVFVSLYEKGLIYQGFRITNWCPRCQTALCSKTCGQACHSQSEPQTASRRKSASGQRCSQRRGFRTGEAITDIVTSPPADRKSVV